MRETLHSSWQLQVRGFAEFPERVLQLIMSYRKRSQLCRIGANNLIKGLDEDGQLGRAADRRATDRIVLISGKKICNLLKLTMGSATACEKTDEIV